MLRYDYQKYDVGATAAPGTTGCASDFVCDSPQEAADANSQSTSRTLPAIATTPTSSLSEARDTASNTPQLSHCPPSKPTVRQTQPRSHAYSLLDWNALSIGEPSKAHFVGLTGNGN